MKTFKTHQENSTLNQEETSAKTFNKKILCPSFTASYLYDLKLANKKNLFFKRIKNGKVVQPQQFEQQTKQDYQSRAFQKLIKRNLKYIRGTASYNFGPRPFLCLVNEALHQELCHKDYSLLFEDINTNMELEEIHLQKELEKRLSSSFSFLLKHRTSVQHLMLFCYIMHNRAYQRKYFRHFHKTTSLSLVYNEGIEINSAADLELNKISRSLKMFSNLQKISLDFSYASFDFSQGQYVISSQSLLCEIIKVLSQVPTLNVIEIKMQVVDLESTPCNIKAFTEKLTQLKSLRLDFRVSCDPRETSKIFTTLLPLTTLRHLSINLDHGHTNFLNDLCGFISSLKSLESLEFTCQALLWSQYDILFQAIQKLKSSLIKLTVVQKRQMMIISFDYSILFKTLDALKKLTSLKIDLGYRFDENELDSLPLFLLKRKALKEVHLSLLILSRGRYEISEGFYADIEKLRGRLEKFKLYLRSFPEDAEKEIHKIIIKDKYNLKNFDCKSAPFSFWGEPTEMEFTLDEN